MLYFQPSKMNSIPRENFQTSGHFSRNIKYFGCFISLKAAVHMDINSHFFGRVNVP